MGFLDRIKQAVGDVTASFRKPEEQQIKKPRKVSFARRTKQVVKPKSKPAEVLKRQEMIKSLQRKPKDIINERVGSEAIRSFTGIAPPTNSKASRKVGEVATSIAAEIARSFPRVAVSVGLTAQGEIERKRTGLAPKTTQATASTGFEKFILGNNPVKSIPARTQEARTVIKKTLRDMGVSEGASNFTAMKLAPVAIVGSTALDLIPGSSPAKSGLKGIGKEVASFGDEAFDVIKAMRSQGDLLGFNPKTVLGVQKILKKYNIQDANDLRRIEELSRPIIKAQDGTADFIRGVVNKDVAGRTPERKNFFLKPVKNVQEKWKEIQTSLVDKTTPINQVLNQFEKSTGSKINIKRDVREQYQRLLFATDRAGVFMRDHGLNDVIKGVDDLAEFSSYLVRKQALRVEEFGIETGLDIAESRQFVGALDGKYKDMAAKVTQYSQRILDEMVDAGLTSREVAEGLKKKFPDYVPLNRIMDEIEETGYLGSKAIGSLSSQSLIQELKGSKRAIQDPLISLVNKTQDLFRQAETNRVAKMMSDYKDLPGNPFGIRAIKDGDFVDSSEGTFSALIKGEKQRFAIGKEYADVLKNVNSEQLNLILRVLRVPVRVFKAGVTGLFPPFLVQNVVRDSWTAIVNSRDAMNSIANPKVFMASLMDTIKHGKLYDDAVRNAGVTNSFDVLRDTAEATVGSIRSQRDLKSRIKYVVKSPKELLRTVENVIARSEEIRRLSEFEGVRRGLKAQGVSDEVADMLAGKAAREVTANFRNQGTMTQQISSFIPFFSAAVQGSKSFIDALKRNPKGTAAKLAATVFLPSTAVATWNLSSPDRRAAYESIQEWEKENNLIIVPPNPTQDEDGRWNVIKIPAPPHFASLMNAPRKVVEAMFKVDELRFMDFADSFWGSLDPTGIDIKNGRAFGRSLLNAFTPQQVKPGLEVLTGQSLFTGAKIADTKSGTAKAIEKLPISPANVEHLVKGYFGSLGSSALNFSDQALAKLGLIAPEEIGGESMIQNLIRRFGKATGGAEDQKARDIADKRLEEKEAALSAFDKEVVRLMKELQALPPESRTAAINKLNTISPRVIERMGEILEAETKNFTGTDYAIQRGTIEDGTRAKIIVDIMTERKMNNTQIQEFLADLGEKKLLTNEVLGQVVELLTKE